MVILANSNVHRLMVDDGSDVDILYLDAYNRMGLTETALSSAASLLYRFIGDHVILKDTTKLATTVGEHPWVSIVVIDFFVVDCPSTINGIIGRPLLKALKAITSTYHLTIKFPTAKGTREVWDSQYDSRECYKKSLKPEEKESRLPQRMEVGKIVTRSSKNSR